MSKSWEPVEIEGIYCLRETELAICIATADYKEAWIPKKLIDDDSEVYQVGTEGTLVIPEWLAIEKELA